MRNVVVVSGVLGIGTALVFALAALAATMFPNGTLVNNNGWNGGCFDCGGWGKPGIGVPMPMPMPVDGGEKGIIMGGAGPVMVVDDPGVAVEDLAVEEAGGTDGDVVPQP